MKTGISFLFPRGTYGRLAARSGLARDYSLVVGGGKNFLRLVLSIDYILALLGVIDADYRGEIKGEGTIASFKECCHRNYFAFQL